MTPNQVIAYNLRELRAERTWTQDRAAEEIARFSGVCWSKATFSLIERSVDGTRIKQFSGDEIIAICRAFEVPILRLFTPPESTAGHPVRIGIYNGARGIDSRTFFEAISRGHVQRKRRSK